MTTNTKLFSMNLYELLKEYYSDKSLKKIIISGLSHDSRRVSKNYLFIAFRGEKVNGIEFINSAIEQGASAVVWESNDDVDVIQINWRKTSLGKDVPIIAISDLKQKAGVIADRFYGSPSNNITVCGITGTNGKTSCSHFLAQMMSFMAPCGVMGTLGSGLYNDLKETGYTTPDVITCHQWLAEIQQLHAKYAVMEVSSHALVQGRVNGIHFNNTVFTNLSRDHLDYHGDIERYKNAKAKLFGFSDLENAIINVDDEAGRSIAESLSGSVRCIRYGLNNKFNPDVYGYDLELDHNGLSMQVKTAWGEGELFSPIMGHFNASNLLAVLSVMLLQGIEFKDALIHLHKIQSVPGRMQRLGGNNQPLIIVDYAHTPDALEQALISLREHTQHELWCVFGCGGDRDKGKRPMMGVIAEARADFIVLTSDNPRSENPLSIIEDIKAGIKEHKNIRVEDDRLMAIHFAINNTKAGDVVLIAGKGHENYQIIGDIKYPFNDVNEVEQQLGVCRG